MGVVSEKQRKDIVINQLVVSNISDEQVIEVISSLPRTLFLEGDLAIIGSSDSPIEYKKNRHMLDMPTMGNILEIANFQETDVVLVVGSGLGYGAGVISKFANRVICIEDDNELSEKAEKTFKSLGLNNVEIHQGNLSSIKLLHPFNRVFFEGAFYDLPKELSSLLDSKTDLIAIERKENLAKIVHIKEVDGKQIVIHGRHTATPYMKGYGKKEKFSF